MATTMELIISATDKATAVIKNVEATAVTMPEKVGAAFKTLGSKSDDVFAKMEADAKTAFDEIKRSGIASAEELTRAEKALGKELGRIHEESAGAFGKALEKQAVASAGFVETIKSHWLAIGLAVSAAMMVIDKAFAMIERYANFAEVKEQLNLMAGAFKTTGTAITNAMKEVSGGQFSIEQATKSAAAALKNSLTPEMIIGLTQAAAAFNDVAGVSVPQAFEALADAVQKGSARAAVSIVGKDGLGDAMKELANGVDDAGKSGALYEAIMAKTAVQTKLTAGATQSLGDSIDKAKAQWSDFTLKLSEYATTGAYAIAAVFTAVAAALTRVAAGAVAAYSALQTLSMNFTAAAESMSVAKDLWGSASELSKEADSYMNLAGAVGAVDTVMKSAGAGAAALAPALASAGVSALASAADSERAAEKWKLIGGTWTDVSAGASGLAGAITGIGAAAGSAQGSISGVASGIAQVTANINAMPTKVGIEITTNYVEKREATSQQGPSPSPYFTPVIPGVTA